MGYVTLISAFMFSWGGGIKLAGATLLHSDDISHADVLMLRSFSVFCASYLRLFIYLFFYKGPEQRGIIQCCFDLSLKR